jgi:hypothetical protein
MDAAGQKRMQEFFDAVGNALGNKKRKASFAIISFRHAQMLIRNFCLAAWSVSQPIKEQKANALA